MGGDLPSVTKKMLDYMDRCESLEVHINELEHVVLAPDPDVDVKNIELHARGERQQMLFHTFSQKGTSDFWTASVERWDEHERMLIIHEQKCQELCQAIEQQSERQELLVIVMERKKALRKEALEEFHKQIFQEIKDLEEQLSKEELDLLGKKHSLGRMKKEREHAKKRSLPFL